MDHVSALVRKRDFPAAIQELNTLLDQLNTQQRALQSDRTAETAAAPVELREALRLRGICFFHTSQFSNADFRRAISTLPTDAVDSSAAGQRQALEQLLQKTCDAALDQEASLFTQFSNSSAAPSSSPQKKGLGQCSPRATSRRQDGGDDIEADRHRPAKAPADAAATQSPPTGGNASSLFPALVGIRYLMYKSSRASERFEEMEAYAKQAWLSEKCEQYAVSNLEFLLRYLKRTPGLETCRDLLYLEYDNAWAWCTLGMHLAPGHLVKIIHKNFCRRQLFVRALTVQQDFAEAWHGLAECLSPEEFFLELAEMCRQEVQVDGAAELIAATEAAKATLWEHSGEGVDAIERETKKLATRCVTRLINQTPKIFRSRSASEVLAEFTFQQYPLMGGIPVFYEDVLFGFRGGGNAQGGSPSTSEVKDDGNMFRHGGAAKRRRPTSTPSRESNAAHSLGLVHSHAVITTPLMPQLQSHEAAMFMRHTLFSLFAHAAQHFSRVETARIEDRLFSARHCAEKAVELKPELAAAWLTLGKAQWRAMCEQELAQRARTRIPFRRRSSSLTRVNEARRNSQRGATPGGGEPPQTREQSFSSFRKTSDHKDRWAAAAQLMGISKRERRPSVTAPDARGNSGPTTPGNPSVLGHNPDPEKHDDEDLQPLAVRSLLSCLNAQNENAEAWFFLGMVMRDGEQVHFSDCDLERKNCFERSLRFQRDRPEAWIRIGQCLQASEHIVLGGSTAFTAKDCVATALRYKWEFSEAWAYLARELCDRSDTVLITGREYSQQSCLEMVLRYKPNHAEGWHDLGCAMPSGSTAVFSLRTTNSRSFTLHKSAEKDGHESALSAVKDFTYSRQQCLEAAVRWNPQCEEAWGSLAGEVQYGEARVHGRLYTQEQCMRRAKGEDVEGRLITDSLDLSSAENEGGCIIS